ncbi:hypothetical protein O9G_001897 [Rozella allomycis CSF55]|uniref:Uncharacterized protein n=1 Tax=Rozella allomycis (strain CSF55) TaxID=988480 RepID=A0A075AWD8_ROZAC|nr:hypothetical protein O9G_001897 [Rozella allomycis CSF55]|eukprot:EPZ34595.1 hypothetical protein O9G_001897 [Rozella allomycis CSF55]
MMSQGSQLAMNTLGMQAAFMGATHVANGMAESHVKPAQKTPDSELLKHEMSKDPQFEQRHVRASDYLNLARHQHNVAKINPEQYVLDDSAVDGYNPFFKLDSTLPRSRAEYSI